jgi:nucleoside-diphosphate-sugar epimerase
MKVLVFGGTGWVGHNIALQFNRAGFDTTICSRGQKKNFIDRVDGISMLTGDKSNPQDMAGIFEEKYDIVVDSVPTESSIDSVFKLARGLKHYIHCSSTGGYAPLPAVPGDETMPYGGFENGTGWAAKAIYDTKVMDLFNRQGFPATVIRPCYITGPGMLPLDNLGGRREDFIPDIIAGKELDLPDNGLSLLQPIHVEDLAHSFLLAALAPGKSLGQIYNICLKKAVPVKRYLQINAEALNTSAKINFVPLEEMLKKHAGHVHETGLRFLATHMCFDISKAEEQLGYKPAHTTEQAIEETARWAAEKLK